MDKKDTSPKKSLFIEDIVAEAVFGSTDLVSDIYKQISLAQSIKINTTDIISANQLINEAEGEYVKLFRRFQDKYIIDINNKEELNQGIVFHTGKSYSYMLSTLCASMRGNIKDKGLNAGLALDIQQRSYSELVNIILKSLEVLNNTIHLKRVELENYKSLLINRVMVFLTTMAVLAAIITVFTN